MFSGIIRDLGKVVSVNKGELSAQLELTSNLFKDTQIGDSVAVSGVCLTVSKLQLELAIFDVSSETLRVTSLGSLVTGSLVNLENPLTLSTLLHGHLVQGHVDGLGKISEILKEGETYKVFIELTSALIRYLVPKGSITVDGVSLTVGEVEENRFSLYIIPKTWDWTTFSRMKLGDLVNIEIDILAKYVERLSSPLAN